MRFELREMDFGTIIDRSLKLFKDNFLPLVVIIGLFYGPFLFMMNYSQMILFHNISGSNFFTNLMDNIMKGNSSDLENLTLEDVFNEVESWKFLAIYMVVAFLLFFLSPLAYLSVYRVLSQYIIGASTSVGESIRFATTKYLTLVLSFILATILFIAGLCFATVGAVMISFLIPCLGAFLAFILIILFTFFTSLFISFLPCVIANENVTTVESLSRSWKLLKGFWWRSLGIYILTSIIFGVVVWIFSGIGQAVGSFLPENLEIPYNSAISTLFTVVFQPIMWAVIFLIYVDIRIRKEGFDVNILAERTIGPDNQIRDEAIQSGELIKDKDDSWS